MRLMYIAFSYMASLGQKEDCNRLRGLFNQIVVPAIKKESDTKLVDVAVHALHAYCRRGLEITNIFIHVFVEVSFLSILSLVVHLLSLQSLTIPRSCTLATTRRRARRPCFA